MNREVLQRQHAEYQRALEADEGALEHALMRVDAIRRSIDRTKANLAATAEQLDELEAGARR